MLIKIGDFLQRVESAAVRIAGLIGEFLQLAEDRDIGIGTQNLFQLRQGSDPSSAQELPKGICGKGDGPHNAIVPPVSDSIRMNYSITPAPLLMGLAVAISQ